MCLALPAQVLSVDKDLETAIVALGPVKKEISTALLEDVTPGEYVLIHVGYALHKVSAKEAERTLAMIREAGEDPELAAIFAGEAAS
jgi:hydrogenase expression/formation protein HypC